MEIVKKTKKKNMFWNEAATNYRKWRYFEKKTRAEGRGSTSDIIIGKQRI